MNFQQNLAAMPNIDHLSGLNVLNQQDEIVHHIPAVAGKLGSLRLYNALSEQFQQQLTAQAARQGLLWFAEHVADAENNPGKHPNIDLLCDVITHNRHLILHPLSR
ncbi:hypothetical protein A1D23_01635 [Chelonobacter oris]|uniref:RNA polymerase subunit sigma-32 n=1 Tax=Chelonobacter oris TaxID=505317 RepID=A0A0A3AME9_9PAST|nr:DUF2322 family protein [Chelonobacter oris]KGQ70521.1 RNA polymerase subunit sigma-32 [Chelonobacter oris]MDH3000562.1 hypothetical protein [Chelonobacter oris]